MPRVDVLDEVGFRELTPLTVVELECERVDVLELRGAVVLPVALDESDVREAVVLDVEDADLLVVVEVDPRDVWVDLLAV